MMQEMNSKCK